MVFCKVLFFVHWFLHCQALLIYHTFMFQSRAFFSRLSSGTFIIFEGDFSSCSFLYLPPILFLSSPFQTLEENSLSFFKKSESMLFKSIESLNLSREFENYSYLNQSGCTSVSSINDAENFKIVEVSICCFLLSVPFDSL